MGESIPRTKNSCLAPSTDCASMYHAQFVHCNSRSKVHLPTKVRYLEKDRSSLAAVKNINDWKATRISEERITDFI